MVASFCAASAAACAACADALALSALMRLASNIEASTHAFTRNRAPVGSTIFTVADCQHAPLIYASSASHHTFLVVLVLVVRRKVVVPTVSAIADSERPALNRVAKMAVGCAAAPLAFLIPCVMVTPALFTLLARPKFQSVSVCRPPIDLMTPFTLTGNFTSPVPADRSIARLPLLLSRIELTFI